ncbi:MAG TPA: cryptochrome/photolyase family protein [Saprospiraceae bacterium]|nr:cryptochrome/photolyase family protein [Saprospiraceae bacterium]
MIREIRLLLGDQLNPQHTWFEDKREDVLYVMMEIRPEYEYVIHHIQKITGIFAAMRNFSDWLEEEGHKVRYLKINDQDNAQSFSDNINSLLEKTEAEKLSYLEPDEYRLDELLLDYCKQLDIETEMHAAEHFLTDRQDVKAFSKDRKSLIMEYFYRNLRKKYNVLMDDGDPVTGKWNYDQSNRKKLPKGHEVPKPITYQNDLTEVYEDIQKAELPYIGEIQPNEFIWPISPQQATQLLDAFVEKMLPNFGRYQDALSDDHWSLYHSRLSFALNTKMLHPLQVIEKVEKHWRQNGDEADIAQVEGFIRQILGWREFMRGIYWMKMPEYANMNFFEAENDLPEWYWTGETKMRCLSKAIGQSLEHAYAHHIQRLMITGNFALLTGVEPSAVDRWYLGIYIDAFEWVEITNTRGMSQYADGGIVGTKPYVSSASYVHKMGDHCKHCHYDHRKKTGEGACPFNSLYWHFLDRHREKLESNRRMAMMYRVWDKYSDDKKDELRNQAETYLSQIDQL